MLENSLLIVAAYLLGSVATAIITCRLMGLPDPRGVGSGNPGATNVLREGGKKAAIITLLGDMLKGLVPVLVGHALGVADWALAAIGLAAFIGHLYPVYFGFKGGKGVATALGVSLGFHWGLGLAVLVTWLAMAFLTRISSLSALTASLLAPLYAWLITGSTALTVAAALMAVLVFWRHRSNIRNLLDGTEGRIGAKK
ncbi:MAG: glycerol-3-phosphate 1-O-acyltransferase PlsY [Chromatiales bacterium]|nr:glycerol-3-phosphate 1-O-acyltransferase PlsY [Chromatiales bacterium]